MRLLPLLALAQVAGIWVADRGWIGSDVAFASGSLTFGLMWVIRPGVRGRRFFSTVVAFLAGALSLAVRLESAQTGLVLPAEPVIFEGVLADVASGSGWARADIDQVVGVEAEARSLPYRVRLIDDGERLGLRELTSVVRGTRLRVKARLQPLRDARNPGSRNRTRQGARLGIGALGHLVDPTLRVIRGPRPGFSPIAAIRADRSRISEKLAAEGRGSELLRALALGDRAGLSTEVRDAFRQLGLSHLLAVSGLHLALVASLIFAAVRMSVGRSAWLAARWDTRTAALFAGVLVSILYALYAGWGTPVRRALILLLALALTVARSRPGLHAEPIAAASMAVLAFEPAALFDAGTQLSFGAAGALVFAARRPDRPNRGWLGARANALEFAARSSATAVAATAPITAWQFGAVAPIGLLANLVAIPWTALVVLPSAMLAALVTGCGFESLAAVWVPTAARVAAATLEFAIESAKHLPPLVVTARPPLIWVCGVGVVLAVTLCAQRTLFRIGGAVLVSGLLAWAPAAQIEPPPPRLIVLEVGQGSASIIQGRQAAVLVDAGGDLRGSDWGQRAVLPALAALGVDRLDLVVVSHGDRDHRGGIPSVLTAIPVGEVWIPFGAASDLAFGPVWRAARERGVAVRERGAGSPPVSLGDIRITPLWPPASANGAESGDGISSRNDRSLVVGVEAGGVRLLLPGDLEARAEQALIRGAGNLRADVLVLPHHGSRSSSSAAFLEVVGASVAIASAPCGGRFGMPHREVLDRAKNQGITTWWTGRDGAVVVALRNPLAVWGRSRGLMLEDCQLQPAASAR